MFFTYMNEDLKIDVYQRLVNEVDSSEKESVKKTAVVLLAKKFANGIKEVYFFSSDFMDDGEDMFQMDYNIEYTNGDFHSGNCMINVDEVVSAFGFANYDALRAYFADKYSDDENAWQKIIKEMQDKGLSPDVDESEGGNNFITNI